MSSLLAVDQIARINAAFPSLVDHIRSVLAKDHTAVGLMYVHCKVESFNTDKLALIFQEFSFLSPVEKKALVRAAIYHLMASEPELFKASVPAIAPVVRPTAVTAEQPKAFTPPQFKLNVNRASDFHGQAPADVSVAKPVVTSTHTSKVAKMVNEGSEQSAAETERLNAAVQEIRDTEAKDLA